MSARRGQTLVLFALSLLLLTLMVLMTLGIGMRIHEREEQQTIADAAAYSEAVAEARAFNVVAVQNRVIVADMASLAAAQAMLSWVGFYHGTLNQARDTLAAMATGPCAGRILNAKAAIEAEDLRLINVWEKPGPYTGLLARDDQAADYIRKDLYMTVLDVAREQRAVYLNLTKGVTAVGNRVVTAAQQGSPWDDLSADTTQDTTDAELTSAVDLQQQRPIDQVRAMMATRGVDPFISSREGNARTGDISAGRYVQNRLNMLMAGDGLTATVTDVGTAYLGTDGPQLFSGAGETTGLDGDLLNKPAWTHWHDAAKTSVESTFRPWGAWAQDRGTYRMNPPPGCAVPTPVDDSFGYLVTTNANDKRSNHMWRRGQTFDYLERCGPSGGFQCTGVWVDDADRPWERHHFTKDARPGTADLWPVFVDYESSNVSGSANDRANLQGQPKTLVAIDRDYLKRKTRRDPWELDFRFRFARTGGGSEIDLRTFRPGLRQSSAIAAGLAYYHRGRPAVGADDHAQEPPNFLNPFWRATLVASDVDEGATARGRSVINTLTSRGDVDAASTLKQLRANGYEAMP